MHICVSVSVDIFEVIHKERNKTLTFRVRTLSLSLFSLYIRMPIATCFSTERLLTTAHSKLLVPSIGQTRRSDERSALGFLSPLRLTGPVARGRGCGGSLFIDGFLRVPRRLVLGAGRPLPSLPPRPNPWPSRSSDSRPWLSRIIMELCSFQDFRYAPTSTTRSGDDSFHPEMLVLTSMIGLTNQGIHPSKLYHIIHYSCRICSIRPFVLYNILLYTPQHPSLPHVHVRILDCSATIFSPLSLGRLSPNHYP